MTDYWFFTESSKQSPSIENDLYLNLTKLKTSKNHNYSYPANYLRIVLNRKFTHVGANTSMQISESLPARKKGVKTNN